MDQCCLTNAAQPLTHTLGYAYAAYSSLRYSGDGRLLDAGAGRRMACLEHAQRRFSAGVASA